VGRWIDRVGAARVLRRGTLLVLAGAWLPVLKLSIPTLFMMALLLGIGYNLVSMAGLHTAATLGDSGSSRQRLANYGWLGLGFSSSATLGPSIAGVLIDRHGFHVALFCMACCTLVAVALVFTRLGQPLPTLARRAHAGDPTTISAPTGWFDLMRLPSLRRLLLVAVTVSSSWDLFVVMLPVVGTRLGFSASIIGSISSAFALGVFFSRALTPWLGARFAEWHTVRASLSGIVILFLLLPWAHTPAPFIAISFLLGASIGLSQPNILSLLHAATPDTRTGEALGLRYFIGNCSSVLMPFAFGLTVGVVGVLPILWSSAAISMAGLVGANRAARQPEQ
jgi:MFS family permease